MAFVLWALFPLVAGADYGFAEYTNIALVMVVLSMVGIVGSLMAGTHPKISSALMAVAVIPAIGALFIPGALVLIACIVEMRQIEQPGTPGLAG